MLDFTLEFTCEPHSERAGSLSTADHEVIVTVRIRAGSEAAALAAASDVVNTKVMRYHSVVDVRRVRS